MAERLTPGVYVEEKSGGVRPIQGASTSTAGFVGVAERGIPARPFFLRSFSDYTQRFGGHRRDAAGHLAAAVQGFFTAGGQRAYVVRVLPDDATSGQSADLAGRGPDVWGATRPALRVRAKGNGAWSNALRVHVRASTAYPDVAFQLQVSWVENGRTRVVETFDDVRMDPDHESYVGRVVADTSQYIEVDDLYQSGFVDADPRGLPPLPESVAALVSREPAGDGDRFAVPRGARLQLRWSDLLSGTASGVDGAATSVVFDDEDTPGEIAGPDVLMTTAELATWLGTQLGAQFRVTGSGGPAQLVTTSGPWDTSDGDRSVLEVDGTAHDIVYAPLTAAALDLGGGPFGLDAGNAVEVVVNGASQVYTLQAGDVTPGAATAAELVDVLNEHLTGVQAFVDGTLRLRTDARGSAAALALAGGGAAVFGNPATSRGAGNVADPQALTPAELAAAVNALPGVLPVRAAVVGTTVLLTQTDVAAPHTYRWVSDPGPAEIVPAAAAGPVTGPLPGGPVRIEPAVASRAYLAVELPDGLLDLSATTGITVTARSGALVRAFGVDPAALPDPAAAAPELVAAAFEAAVTAAEAGVADPIGPTVELAGRHLVFSAPVREDGLALSIAAAGAAPWVASPIAVPGHDGQVVDDQRGVSITLGEQAMAGVARALPRLFGAARAAGRQQNDPADPGLRPAQTEDRPVAVVGGTDGMGTPGLPQYVAALPAFDAVDLGMLAAPGHTDGGFVAELSAYCDRHDVFYVADGIGSTDRDFAPTADDVRQYVDGLPARSRNAGMFYPWIEVVDPVGVGRDPRRFVPPSGHMCGVFARTDATRGVWKAPAGIEATVSGAIGLQHTLVDADQALLNPIGLNCIRQFPGAGIVAWGSRTLASEVDPEARYVPVRRMSLFLKESLRNGLLWVVFEPNDEDLWAQIRLNVTAFMMGLFRQDAFQGATPAEAFRVQCDRETNPQELVDQGIVTTRVAFAPLKPAEFVVVELSQKSLVEG